MFTTTRPWRAKDVPSYQGFALQSAKKPPPWIQTSTGREPSVTVRPDVEVRMVCLVWDAAGRVGGVSSPEGFRW
jgi:hypothetical protein